MTKWIIALVAVIVLQAGASLWLSQQLQDTRKTLGSTVASLDEQKAAVAALRASQARIQTNTARVAKQNQEAARELQAAIDALADHGSRPVPQPIIDSLCKRLRCAHSDD